MPVRVGVDAGLAARIEVAKCMVAPLEKGGDSITTAFAVKYLLTSCNESPVFYSELAVQKHPVSTHRAHRLFLECDQNNRQRDDGRKQTRHLTEDRHHAKPS